MAGRCRWLIMWVAVFLLMGVCGSATSQAQATITVTPSGSSSDWSVTVSAGDLLGTGLDLPSAISSAQNHTRIDIVSDQDWEVQVRRTDINWDESLAFYVTLTDAGEPVAGGLITQTVGHEVVVTGTSLFISGHGDRNNVGVELSIRNLSLAVPPATYSTSVTYTVVEVGGP